MSINVFLASMKMAMATFLSRILGLVREQVIAFYFGASGFTDAFLVAYRIPNLLRDLFAEGAFSAAFVPSFVEANLKNKEEARKLLWSLFIFLGLVTFSFSLLIFIFAPEIITVFAPSFVESSEKFELTVLLTRVMSPFLFLVSLAALFMGVLNSLKIFFIPSLAPAFFNLTTIASVLFFVNRFSELGLNPILSVAVGVTLGGLVQAMVQLPLIFKRGYGPIRLTKIFTRESKKVIVKLGPGLLGFAATQINLIVNTILASGTVVGAVSWLSFAFRLFQLPVGILSVSIGNSNLVLFSKAWKAGDKKQAVELLQGSYFLSLYLVLPAMIALILCSDEMINVIFERGKFTADSTVMTAKALRWYALGLPFYSLYKIFVPTFYSIDRQKIPVYCSIVGIILNIIFSVALVPSYGFEILAVGTTLSILLNACAQAWILKSDLNFELNFYLNIRLVKILLSGITTFFLVYFVKTQIHFLEFNFLIRCGFLFGYLVVIALCYFGFCAALGERELFKQILAKFIRKNS
ncbi:MAG: murein biosynthesis integral membrane protein MurJ [Halobacteriovoraceae bacterium]|nr:murein biosynthesis integral membrane protein MurJ [Halobacteriovoraceae bacterium]|tara:strand:+ start:7079 stop:8644 length:1566 start_codon:yes stop_codon:yes gene_type:complete